MSTPETASRAAMTSPTTTAWAPARRVAAWDRAPTSETKDRQAASGEDGPRAERRERVGVAAVQGARPGRRGGDVGGVGDRDGAGCGAVVPVKKRAPGDARRGPCRPRGPR